MKCNSGSLQSWLGHKYDLQYRNSDSTRRMSEDSHGEKKVARGFSMQETPTNRGVVVGKFSVAANMSPEVAKESCAVVLLISINLSQSINSEIQTYTYIHVNIHAYNAS